MQTTLSNILFAVISDIPDVREELVNFCFTEDLSELVVHEVFSNEIDTLQVGLFSKHYLEQTLKAGFNKL